MLAAPLLSAAAAAGEFGIDSEKRMEAEIGRFNAAHSIGYLGQLYFEILDSSGLQSGFGIVRQVVDRKSAPANLKHEIFLNGRVFRPRQTVKVTANGIPGTPDSSGWAFRMESGRINAFSSVPWGNPERAEFLGATHDLRKVEGKNALRGYLKRIPDALIRMITDTLGAIRYFNAAPEGETVANLSYREGIETIFNLGSGGYEQALAKHLEDRLALNRNDLAALGIKSQALCHDGRAAEAEQVMQVVEGIRPDYYRLHLARATCLEKSGKREEAIAGIRLAMQGAWDIEFPSLLKRVAELGDKERKELTTKQYNRIQNNLPRRVMVPEYDFKSPLQIRPLPAFVRIHSKSGQAEGMGTFHALMGKAVFIPGISWIELAGMRFFPGNTDSIRVWDMPGLPADSVWAIVFARGTINAFSFHPLFAPEHFFHPGQDSVMVKDLEASEKLESHWRRFPKSAQLEKGNGDPVMAIRIANSGRHRQGGKELQDLLDEADYLCKVKRFGEADSLLAKAKGWDQQYSRTHFHIGECLERREDIPGALRAYRQALRNPGLDAVFRKETEMKIRELEPTPRN